MKPVKKVVILVAGLGTRFLPMTKTIPKTMLPIFDKPVIQYLVEEAVASGIKEIVIVAGQGKEIIKEHFDSSSRLEKELLSRGKIALLKTLPNLEKSIKITYVEQKEALGDGHALLCAEKFLGREPFAVLFGDDIVDSKTPALRQLLDVYKKTGTPVICVEKVAEEKLKNYGVIKIKSQKGRLIEVNALVEKPSPAKAPSSYGIIGKYVCTPEILDALRIASKTNKKSTEIRLIDGLRTHLYNKNQIHAWEVNGQRFDTGTPRGLLEANIAFAKKSRGIF